MLSKGFALCKTKKEAFHLKRVENDLCTVIDDHDLFWQGLPSPESEKNAIEVVMQYAIEELGFPVNKIFIYAWSIGEC